MKQHGADALELQDALDRLGRESRLGAVLHYRRREHHAPGQADWAGVVVPEMVLRLAGGADGLVDAVLWSTVPVAMTRHAWFVKYCFVAAYEPHLWGESSSLHFLRGHQGHLRLEQEQAASLASHKGEWSAAMAGFVAKKLGDSRRRWGDDPQLALLADVFVWHFRAQMLRRADAYRVLQAARDALARHTGADSRDCRAVHSLVQRLESYFSDALGGVLRVGGSRFYAGPADVAVTKTREELLDALLDPKTVAATRAPKGAGGRAVAHALDARYAAWWDAFLGLATEVRRSKKLLTGAEWARCSDSLPPLLAACAASLTPHSAALGPALDGDSLVSGLATAGSGVMRRPFHVFEHGAAAPMLAEYAVRPALGGRVDGGRAVRRAKLTAASFSITKSIK